MAKIDPEKRARWREGRPQLEALLERHDARQQEERRRAERRRRRVRRLTLGLFGR
jgi:hypothetical protein